MLALHRHSQSLTQLMRACGLICVSWNTGLISSAEDLARVVEDLTGSLWPCSRSTCVTKM